MIMTKLYIQYGCGNEAIDGWINFDASPTLRIQKMPIIGRLLRKYLNCHFAETVGYGDIVKGLPVGPNSADGVFCSHVLEHLSLGCFHKALDNTFRILKRGGVFRCIVPDLELYMKDYINALAGEDQFRNIASVEFCTGTRLGRQTRNRGLVGSLSEMYGNSLHLWMWDKYSLSRALLDHGFTDITVFQKGNSDDEMMLRPERDHQFHRGIGLHCIKP